MCWMQPGAVELGGNGALVGGEGVEGWGTIVRSGLTRLVYCVLRSQVLIRQKRYPFGKGRADAGTGVYGRD